MAIGSSIDAELGAPELQQHEGREWLRSSCTINGVDVDVIGPSRAIATEVAA